MSRDGHAPGLPGVAAAVVLASVAELVGATGIFIALGQMRVNLGVTLDTLVGVPLGYLFASALAMPAAPWLAERYTPRRAVAGGLALLSSAAVLSSRAEGLGPLILWQALAGLGGGVVVASGQILLFATFPPTARHKAAAVFGLSRMLSPVLALPLAGVLVYRIGWPAVFQTTAVLGAGALLAALAWLPRGPLATGRLADVATGRPEGAPAYGAARPSFDAAGFALFATALGALVFVVGRGDHLDWFTSPLVVAMTALGLTALAGAVWRELTAAAPLLDLRLLRRDRALAAGVALAAVTGVGVYGSLFALVMFSQRALGFSPETTGWVLFPGAVATALAMFPLARLGPRAGRRLLVAAGLACMAWGLALHANFTPQTAVEDTLWPVVLRGVGAGLVLVPLTGLATGHLAGRALAHGAAFFNLALVIAGGLGAAAFVTVIEHRTAVHRGWLVEYVTPYDRPAQERLAMLTRGLAARGVTPALAPRAATAALDRMVQGQAAVLAYGDVFRTIALVLALGLPLVPLLAHASADSRRPGAVAGERRRASAGHLPPPRHASAPAVPHRGP
jgi:DHA2 family multidrug resistance protein